MPIQHVISDTRVPVKMWVPIEEVEESALKQIRNVANLPFMYSHLAIMPDVHTGFGATIGSVMATKDVVIPSAAGVDLGCGVLAVMTPFDLDKVRALLPQIKHSIERAIPTGFRQHNAVVDNDPSKKYLNPIGHFVEYPRCMDKLKDGKMDKALYQLGSLGSGNHFLSLDIHEQSNTVWYMIHSGSRNIGLSIANHYIGLAKERMTAWHIELPDKELAYLPTDDDNGKNYLVDALWAQRYAMANREIMSALMARELGYLLNDNKPWTPLATYNCHHNFVELVNHNGHNIYVTRKGAIRAGKHEEGVIPGSMGTPSYIVAGLGNPDSFESSSHGAGRCMSRKQAKTSFTMEDFKKQTEGVLCTDVPGVLDEIPGAYKSIEKVMAYQSDLVLPVYKLREIMCIKGTE